LIDTGFDPLVMGMFAGFKPGRVGSTNNLFVRNFPAIQTHPTADSETVQVLVNGRFILTIEAHNQDPNASIAWAQSAPFDRYNIARTVTLTKLPDQVPMSSVDELNPKNNHDSVVPVTTPKPDGRR
jgi:hypothetical protein